MSKNKIYLCSLFLIISLLLISNLILLNVSISYYKKMKWAQVNPGNLNYYSSDNSKAIARTAKKKRVLFFGDSRIFRWKNMPVLDNCEIINRGINGDTTSGALLRLSNDVIMLKPDLTVIQLGVNDLTAIGVFPEEYNSIEQTCVTNLDRTIDILKKNNIKVIVLTIFPNAEISIIRRLVWSDKIDDAIKEVNDHLVQIGEKDIYVVNCNSIFIDHHRIKSEYYTDALHVNHKAYNELNRIVTPVINNIISR